MILLLVAGSFLLGLGIEAQWGIQQRQAPQAPPPALQGTFNLGVASVVGAVFAFLFVLALLELLFAA